MQIATRQKSASNQKQTPRQKTSQAIASDQTYALNLAPNFQPDVDIVVAEGVAAFGVKGSGKSNACARLLEQLSRYPIPYLVPDTKGEFTGLHTIQHASTFVVATANACPSGYEILNERLQVVMDLRTWDSDEGAALAMSQILNEMFAYASTQNPEDCIPCPCILDEAQYWLPQNQVSYLSKDIARELRDAWHVLATRGRSLGLVPSYFTQNISELHKSVMRQCGLYILMRQTLDNDLDRYCEFIHHSKPSQVKNMIRAFPAGHAVVMLPNGEQLKVVFHQRESQHPSNTPTVRALMRRLFPSQPEQASAPEPEPTPITRKPRARKVVVPEQPEVVQSIHAALEHDSDLSPMELAARIGCDLDTAKAARMSYFYGNMAAAQ
ncbi:MAG: ATP-binding protein [Ktedonobacteraceae bacterium]|nr:ATP-binding protein [Ktedonobacteraceae bacterium]